MKFVVRMYGYRYISELPIHASGAACCISKNLYIDTFPISKEMAEAYRNSRKRILEGRDHGTIPYQGCGAGEIVKHDG